MNRILTAWIAFVLIFIGAANAVCYSPRTEREKRRERIEILTMWKMMEALDLDGETSKKILEIRRKFLTRRTEVTDSLAKDFRRLRELLRDSPGKGNDENLAKVLEDIRQKRTELSTLWKEQYKAVSKLLSVRKQAELVLFLKDFRNEIRLLMRRASRPPDPRFRRGMGGPPMAPPPGDGPGPRTGQSFHPPHGGRYGPPPPPPGGLGPGGPPEPSGSAEDSDDLTGEHFR